MDTIQSESAGNLHHTHPQGQPGADIPTASFLAVDPTTLSLAKLRQFSKSVLFQIHRLENARSALLESIGTQQKSEKGFGGGESEAASANQRLRSMEVLLTQLDKFHRECLVAGEEKRLDTLHTVRRRATDREEKYLADSTDHCNEVLSNRAKELKYQLGLTKHKNEKHDEKVNDIFWTRHEKETKARNALLERIAKDDERRKKRDNELQATSEVKRQEREAKRVQTMHRLEEKERRAEAEDNRRAQSALDRARGATSREQQSQRDQQPEIGGMVRKVLEAGSEGFRENSVAKQRAAILHARTPQPRVSDSSTVVNSVNVKTTRFGQSPSFGRLTKAKNKAPTSDEVEEQFQEKQKLIQKWRDHDHNIIKTKNQTREEKHDEGRYLVHAERMEKIKSVRKKQKADSKRLEEKRQVQTDVSQQLIEEREAHRERTRRRAAAPLPSVDRWEGRANTILASVCEDLTKDFDLNSLEMLKTAKVRKSNNQASSGSAMESVSRPYRGFESWK